MRLSDLGVLILLVVTVGAYAGLWHAGFVWDDVPLVVQNQSLSSLANFPLFFSGDLWAESGAGAVDSGYYRPLVLLSFAVDRALFGLWAPGYHLHSLLWHLGAVYLLYRLLCTMVEGGPALLGATVFALHPGQSEVVAWISARNDAMAAALTLGAVLVVSELPRDARWRWLGGSLLACAAAWSKESAYLLPLLLWIVDAVHERRGDWHRYGAVVAGLAVALMGRLVAGVGSAAWPPTEGWILLKQHSVHFIGTMAASIVWPWPVTSLRDLHWMDAEPLEHALVGWVAIAICGVVMAAVRGRTRRMFIGGFGWAAASIALTLVPIADKGGFGDRFWYLPLVGVAFMLAAVCPVRWSRALVVGFAVPSLIVLHVRVPDWATDRSLWWSAIRDRPTPVNLAGFGHAQFTSERYKRALVGFAGALTTERLATDACPRVVSSAVRLGRPVLGARMGRWALARGCSRTGAINGWLATALAFSGDWNGVRQTLADGPPDPQGRDQVARAALATVDGDHAEVERIAARWSGSGDLRAQVALILAKAGPTGDLETQRTGGETP